MVVAQVVHYRRKSCQIIGFRYSASFVKSFPRYCPGWWLILGWLFVVTLLLSMGSTLFVEIPYKFFLIYTFSLLNSLIIFLFSALPSAINGPYSLDYPRFGCTHAGYFCNVQKVKSRKQINVPVSKSIPDRIKNSCYLESYRLYLSKNFTKTPLYFLHNADEQKNNHWTNRGKHCNLHLPEHLDLQHLTFWQWSGVYHHRCL